MRLARLRLAPAALVVGLVLPGCAADGMPATSATSPEAQASGPTTDLTISGGLSAHWAQAATPDKDRSVHCGVGDFTEESGAVLKSGAFAGVVRGPVAGHYMQVDIILLPWTGPHSYQVADDFASVGAATTLDPQHNQTTVTLINPLTQETWVTGSRGHGGTVTVNADLHSGSIDATLLRVDPTTLRSSDVRLRGSWACTRIGA